MAYIDSLVSDHVKIQPKSGREATEAFLQGSGDVLLSYENEAKFIEGNGDPVEHVTPPQTFKIENPTAVVTKGKGAEQAKAFNDYLFTPAARGAVGAGRLPAGRPHGRGEVRQGLPAAREALDHRRPRRLERGRLDAVQEGHRRHRQDLRRGHPVGAMTTTTRQHEGLVESSPSSGPRAGAPPTGRGAGPGSRPSAPSGSGWWACGSASSSCSRLAALTVHSLDEGLAGFWDAVTSPAAVAAIWTTLVVSVLVALVNAVMGTLIAWVLVRDEFPGKRYVNALIDLPFALPTIVASIVLLSSRPEQPDRCAPQRNSVGSGRRTGLRHAALRRPLGAAGAHRLDRDVEEAAASLGASNTATFRRVVLPTLGPSIISGAGLAFARAVGEYGSVAADRREPPAPQEQQVVSQYIQQQIEIDRPANAAAVSVVLLAISFVTLFVLRLWGSRAQRREERSA